MPIGRSLLVGLAVVTVLLAVPVAAADNVVHTTIPVDQTATFPLGPEAPCFGVAPGTDITVHATGELTQTEVVAGPNAGRIQVQGHESFTFTIATTGTSGGGSQVLNVKAAATDTVRAINVVHVDGTLADGTPFMATFHVHTVVKDGQVKVDVARVTCVQP